MFRTLLICLIMFSSVSITFALDKSESSFNLGNKYFKQKNYPTALSFFIKAHSQGMRKSTLYFNIGVTYFQLRDYEKSEINFKRLLKDKNFHQIAFYNLGLIAEKRKQKKKSIIWYTKAAAETNNNKITQLANIKLDGLLHRKPVAKHINNAVISLAFGSDSNITTSASTSPSNKSDNYLQLFSYINTPISKNMNFKGNLYSINYSNFSNENFMLYSAGLDHSSIIGRWIIIPEFSFSQSTYNNSDYQNTFDLILAGKRKLSNGNRMNLQYRYSDIKSQNFLYNYLQGSRHQFRADYMNRITIGQLRFRYQFELNDRKNAATANYSPTRHEIRTRLKHSLKNNWNISEEIGLRSSNYGVASGTKRNDSRLRLLIAGSKKFKQHLDAGIRYTYTDNKSNITSETYIKNNIQIFTNWNF